MQVDTSVNFSCGVLIPLAEDRSLGPDKENKQAPLLILILNKKGCGLGL